MKLELRRWKVPLAGLFLCALVVSCAASKSNRPYKQSYKFYPCERVISSTPQAHATAAVVLALKENEGTEQWKYVEIVSGEFRVRARNCVRNSKTDCAMVSFSATKSGVVRVSQLAGQPVPAELWDDLYRWMQDFKKAYARFTCYEDEALRNAVRPYGYQF